MDYASRGTTDTTQAITNKVWRLHGVTKTIIGCEDSCTPQETIHTMGNDKHHTVGWLSAHKNDIYIKIKEQQKTEDFAREEFTTFEKIHVDCQVYIHLHSDGLIRTN